MKKTPASLSLAILCCFALMSFPGCAPDPGEMYGTLAGTVRWPGPDNDTALPLVAACGATISLISGDRLIATTTISTAFFCARTGPVKLVNPVLHQRH